MFWKSESTIREIVKDEVRKILKEESEYRITRVYDEEGRLVETDYTYNADAGHLVHIITKHDELDFSIFAGHSRSAANYEQLRKSGANVEDEDRKFNKAHLFNRSDPIPNGFRVDNTGLLIPSERL